LSLSLLLLLLFHLEFFVLCLLQLPLHLPINTASSLSTTTQCRKVAAAAYTAMPHGRASTQMTSKQLHAKLQLSRSLGQPI